MPARIEQRRLWKAALVAGGVACLCSGTVSAGLDQVADQAAALNMSRGAAGREMPPFVLPSLHGQAVRSSDLKGKVVVLNFWATWCGPCKDEMPALDRLRKHFDAQDVAVLTVTTDVQREGIAGFLRELALSLPVLLDESREVSDAFTVRGLPTTVVIDRDGKLVGRAVGPRAWDGRHAVALVQTLKERGR
ncbi:MAG: TlpA family protein disulfide reductase [Nitrospiraceae bacterium]